MNDLKIFRPSISSPFSRLVLNHIERRVVSCYRINNFHDVPTISCLYLLQTLVLSLFLSLPEKVATARTLDLLRRENKPLTNYIEKFRIANVYAKCMLLKRSLEASRIRDAAKFHAQDSTVEKSCSSIFQKSRVTYETKREARFPLNNSPVGRP